MPMLSEMIILWWLFIASQIPFEYIAQYNDRAKREGLARNHSHWSNDFKCCDYWEK